ncbi:MAG: hypothetical protein EOP00_31890 [Pedobacter sp.]|nr:MAG: hypothetical protein EOP00_31890 [Pedobacter sp.]
MKKLVLISLFISLALNSYGQERAKNYDDIYVKFPTLAKFLGKWEYREGNKYFMIELTKYQYITPSGKGGMDKINGTHTYSEQNSVLDASKENEKTIKNGFYDYENKDENVLKFRFKESKYRLVYANGKLSYSPNNPNVLQWSLEEPSNLLHPSESVKFIVPMNVKLTKVKER